MLDSLLENFAGPKKLVPALILAADFPLVCNEKWSWTRLAVGIRMASLVGMSPLQQENANNKPLVLGVLGGWRRSLRARRGQQHPAAMVRKNSDPSITPVSNGGEVRYLLGAQKPEDKAEERLIPARDDAVDSPVSDPFVSDEEAATGTNDSSTPVSPRRARLSSSGAVGRNNSFRNAMQSPMVSGTETSAE